MGADDGGGLQLTRRRSPPSLVFGFLSVGEDMLDSDGLLACVEEKVVFSAVVRDRIKGTKAR